ncbi:MAG: hypothetical protein JST84_05750 [Acidobacteria bacterium]|nr:hypothetical protein [Acidobacteriota bacterium]
MPGLEVKKNNQTFLLEPLGTVSKNDVVIGKWQTDSANKVIVTKDDHTKLSFDVAWAFNADNHLVMSAGDKQFDFHSVAENRVFYRLEDAVLQITPKEGEAFLFELQGDWELTPTHDLGVTISGQKSVIDGFVNDSKSRFIFHFRDKQDPLSGSMLGFRGTWESKQGADGKALLTFSYKQRGKPDGAFSLPQGVAFNTSMNQLMYEYKKGGKVRRIQFIGALEITENFQITYGLERQTASNGTEMVGSTKFVLRASFSQKSFTGNLDLSLQKTDGNAGGTVFSIRGNFTAVRGSVSLRAGFTYTQRTGDALAPSTTRTFGFNTQLTHKNGKIQVNFLTTNSTTKSIVLEINVDIRLGQAHVDSSLNLTMENGEVKGVTFMLGVSI